MTIAELYKIFLDHPIVCTDSRKIEVGCLFFALKGANFDGNQFAVKAIQQGAAYAIIDDHSLKEHPRLILVEDVLATLQKLANYHRQQFEIPCLLYTSPSPRD